MMKPVETLQMSKQTRHASGESEQDFHLVASAESSPKAMEVFVTIGQPTKMGIKHNNDEPVPSQKPL